MLMASRSHSASCSACPYSWATTIDSRAPIFLMGPMSVNVLVGGLVVGQDLLVVDLEDELLEVVVGVEQTQTREGRVLGRDVVVGVLLLEERLAAPPGRSRCR